MLPIVLMLFFEFYVRVISINSLINYYLKVTLEQ